MPFWCSCCSDMQLFQCVCPPHPLAASNTCSFLQPDPHRLSLGSHLLAPNKPSRNSTCNMSSSPWLLVNFCSRKGETPSLLRRSAWLDGGTKGRHLAHVGLQSPGRPVPPSVRKNIDEDPLRKRLPKSQNSFPSESRAKFICWLSLSSPGPGGELLLVLLERARPLIFITLLVFADGS